MIALVFAVAAAAGGYAASASVATVRVGCSMYASPTGSDATGTGSLSSPFRTAQRLVKSLRPGDTGCLNAGAYTVGTYGVNGLGGFHSDTTLSSTPGQTATISGGGLYIWIAPGADYVTIENLKIDFSSTQPAPVSVQIGGNHDRLIGDTITNGDNAATCILLGAGATAVATIIKNNTIHDCGSYIRHGNQDHAIYFQDSVGAQVINNVFYNWSGWAIHLYPNAQGSLVDHNIFVGGHFGTVAFAGDGRTASSNNTVDYNVIAGNSYASYDAAVDYYWGGPVGTANRADHNCLYRNVAGNIAKSPVGFRASGNVIANPAFTNPAKHDYRLRPDSPCLPVVSYDTAAQIQSGAAGASVRHRQRRATGSAAANRRRLR
jgi:Right handed beta helix region